MTLIEVIKTDWYECDTVLYKTKALLDEGANVNAKDSDDPKAMPPLHWAVLQEEDLELVKLLIKYGAEVNVQNYPNDGSSGVGTALHIAAEDRSKFEIVELLIDHGADVNAKDDFGMTALMRADDAYIARLLIDHGADINASDNVGWTALHNAVQECNMELIKLLIDHGADVNGGAVAGKGETPLHCASYDNQEGIVELLINKGADVNFQNGLGNTPLNLIYESVEKTVNLLRKHGGKTAEELKTDIN